MKLGFIGTGKIASSVIIGICSSKISFNKIFVSPRNKKIASNNDPCASSWHLLGDSWVH